MSTVPTSCCAPYSPEIENGFLTLDITVAARWTVLFYTPMTALAVFGFNPAASGSILIPTNLGFGLGGLLVGVSYLLYSFLSSFFHCRPSHQNKIINQTHTL